MVILDTNIVIDYLRRVKPGDSYFIQIAAKIGKDGC